MSHSPVSKHLILSYWMWTTKIAIASTDTYQVAFLAFGYCFESVFWCCNFFLWTTVLLKWQFHMTSSNSANIFNISLPPLAASPLTPTSPLGLVSYNPTESLYSELSKSIIAEAALFHESSVELLALFTCAVESSSMTTSWKYSSHFLVFSLWGVASVVLSVFLAAVKLANQTLRYFSFSPKCESSLSKRRVGSSSTDLSIILDKVTVTLLQKP